jgi:steroid delta-isomerase-like uncharacterized protein
MTTMAIDMEQWAKDLFAAYSSHDVENTLSFYADDAIFEDFALGRFLQGKEELRAHVKEAFTGFPDFKIEMKSFFASGNHACIECIMGGTHKGDLPGMPPTGKHFSVPGVAVIEFKEGKAKREADYWDSASMMRQLGVLPSSPQKQ